MRSLSTRHPNPMLVLLMSLELPVLKPTRWFRRAHDYHGIGIAFRARILSQLCMNWNCLEYLAIFFSDARIDANRLSLCTRRTTRLTLCMRIRTCSIAPSRRLECVIMTYAHFSLGLYLECPVHAGSPSFILFHLIKQERSIINEMLRFTALFYFLAATSTAVLSISAETNLSHAVLENQESKETKILAGPTLVNNSLPDITQFNARFPKLNTSSNAEPAIFCHRNPQPPIPPVFGHTDIVECALLIMAMLAGDSADLHAWQWSPTSPVVLPWTIGVSTFCRIKINALRPGSSDIFQRVMIAQRAALIVSRCVDNLGGVVSVGPREEFQVQVFSFPPRVTA